MERTTVVSIIAIGRLIASTACVCGAVWVMEAGKEGWGWLIFAAIILGCITVGDSE